MEVLKAENRYPLKSRVYWRRRTNYPQGGYWIVETPSGTKNEFFNWSYAISYAVKAVREERNFLRVKHSRPFSVSNKRW